MWQKVKFLSRGVIVKAYILQGQLHYNALWRVAGFPPRGLELTRLLASGLPVEVIDKIRHWSAMSRR